MRPRRWRRTAERLQDVTETVNCYPGPVSCVLWQTVATLLFVAILAGCTEPAGNDWAAARTQLADLRAQGYRGTGIRVAILDTGIDVEHPSLAHLPPCKRHSCNPYKA